MYSVPIIIIIINIYTSYIIHSEVHTLHIQIAAHKVHLPAAQNEGTLLSFYHGFFRTSKYFHQGSLCSLCLQDPLPLTGTAMHMQ